MTQSRDDLYQSDIARIGAIGEVPLILDACAAATGMGFIAVARVTEGRWITCASLDRLGFGLAPGDELDVTTTICQEVRDCRQTIAIPDVDKSEAYKSHPTPNLYGFKSYVSVPIFQRDGEFWGTLCAIDPQPRDKLPSAQVIFELFAKLIGLQLDSLDELVKARADLVVERHTAHLREEFIAVVGHDLRNPVASISAGLSIFGRRLSDHASTALLTELRRAVSRADHIIADLLDLARGRLGDGMQIVADMAVDLEPVFRGVVQEIAQVARQPVEASFDLPRPIQVDPDRLAQLVSNLLGNAALHGDQNSPICLDCAERDGELTIAVSNHGTPIPEDVQASLFLPFLRGGNRTVGKGLGLGLYIASEIARAHGGRIDVVSDSARGTVFTAVLPIRHGKAPSP